MRSRIGLRLKPSIRNLGPETRRAFTSAGRHYFFHDERWGCDVDLLRAVKIPDRPRIVELGSSLGIVLRTAGLLYPDYRSLTAVEFSKRVCSLAERELAHVPRTRVLHTSVEDYLAKSREKTADIVLLLNNTLGNCWADGDIQAHFTEVLAGVRRLLSDGGILLLSVYSGEGVSLGPYGNGLELIEDLGMGNFVGRVSRGSYSGTFFSHLFEPGEVERSIAEADLVSLRHIDRERRLVYVCRREV